MAHYDDLKAFAREVIRLAWEADIDGGDVQELAEKYGLIQPVAFDPERSDHLDRWEGVDEIFEFTEEMR